MKKGIGKILNKGIINRPIGQNTKVMSWKKFTDIEPKLNDAIVIAVNFDGKKRLPFWKKKLIIFGMLKRVEESESGRTYEFYDSTNNCFRTDSVTHWATLEDWRASAKIPA